jgi:hypothetical protein
MAGNTDYFPKKDTQLKGWCNTYRETLPQYAAFLGLTPAEVAEQQQWCDEIAGKISEVDQARTHMKSVTSSKDKTKKDNMAKLRKSIKRMKANTNFGSAVGTHLRIMGGKKYIPEAKDYKPTFKAKVIADHVRLDYVKKGIDGVEVHRMITGLEGWKKLGTDYHSPFIDAQPLKTPGVPEIRRYKMVAIVNDERFGNFSHEIEVVVLFMTIAK